jgi:hypothetical protein
MYKQNDTIAHVLVIILTVHFQEMYLTHLIFIQSKDKGLLRIANSFGSADSTLGGHTYTDIPNYGHFGQSEKFHTYMLVQQSNHNTKKLQLALHKLIKPYFSLQHPRR